MLSFRTLETNTVGENYVLMSLLNLQDFDAWFNSNNLVEEKQLVERLHSVSTY